MASLDDILTTQKNGVVAINSIVASLKAIEIKIDSLITNSASQVAKYISPTVLASLSYQVVVGSGRIICVSIPVHGGAAQIYIYDSATVGGISASNLIYASLPSNASTFTPYQNVNLPYSKGIVIVTDAGMNACVGYNTD